ncbi:ectoine synthase [Micromonospora profundi]|uniref:ectoine synthase n=1 Tax=Micromonospora profundi TaxID=1420889 RepID=UPI0033AF9890
MIVRTRERIEAVEWGNGLSYRFILEADNMGFTVCHTVVRAGTKSQLAYRRHLEACYCIGGRGWVQTADGSQSWELRPGVLYALDQHDAHFLIAAPESDLELVSIFNPPLIGPERHNLDSAEFSEY